MMPKFDALLIVSFGGPEGMADVMPFLDNVLRGKNVPEERKREVAHHYEMFGGVSPINSQNRELKKLLEARLLKEGIHIPVFWGNRNWKPYIRDALNEMKQAGVQRALAYVTSAYGSYSGCRQYMENIEAARQEIGSSAPSVEKIPPFYNHPLFIQVQVERVREQMEKILEPQRQNMHVVFTAHSIPVSMAKNAPYATHLRETCERVANSLGIKQWSLAYQSRSGPPSVPWLGPDVCDELGNLAKKKIQHVIVLPVGFLSDHMEVMYDLDVEAKKKADELGMQFYRAATPGNHPLMIDMITDLVKKHIEGHGKPACRANCCMVDIRR